MENDLNTDYARCSYWWERGDGTQADGVRFRLFVGFNPGTLIRRKFLWFISIVRLLIFFTHNSFSGFWIRREKIVETSENGSFYSCPFTLACGITRSVLNFPISRRFFFFFRPNSPDCWMYNFNISILSVARNTLLVLLRCVIFLSSVNHSFP